MNDPALLSRCLYGLRKVSARCGLLPKSYWIPHSSPADPNDVSFAKGRVSNTRRGLVDGRLVAVKTINSDCITNFNAFKRVRPFPSPTHLLSTSFVICVFTETVHQWDHVEAITTSECDQFPWLRLRFPSVLPCISLDVQRESV